MAVEHKKLDELKGISSQINQLSNEIKSVNESLNVLNITLIEAIKSTDKNAKSMKWITFGLLCIAIAQAIIALN